MVQGLAPSALNITTPNPTQAQLDAWAPHIANPVPGTMTVSAFDLTLEDSSSLGQVQRITFGYNLSFSSTNAFTAEDVPVTLGASVLGLSSTTIVDLTTRQHPYMVAGATSWLSADTRVFKLQPGGMFAHRTLQNDPNAFIQSVIDSLRGSQQANAWFDGLPADEAGAQLEWSQKLDGQPVYNFAICRVHYRAELNPAPDVRVFFRLFPAMTTSTDFQPSTTYRMGGQPGTKIPLLGIVGGEVTTIPFFAEPRRAATDNLNLQTDPKNVDTLKINAGGNETFSYYGCWLDINQPGDKRFPIHPTPLDGGPFTGPAPLQSIADLIRGTHQCLVAEVNFDLDPIAVGATTASSDKLAQRNLAIDLSDNPGEPDTHRVQHTFSIRPTTANPRPTQGPDELMIDWGATPHGTIATLYTPGVSASEVHAARRSALQRNRLTAVDANSVQVEVTGRCQLRAGPGGRDRRSRRPAHAGPALHRPQGSNVSCGPPPGDRHPSGAAPRSSRRTPDRRRCPTRGRATARPRHGDGEPSSCRGEAQTVAPHRGGVPVLGAGADPPRDPADHRAFARQPSSRHRDDPAREPLVSGHAEVPEPGGWTGQGAGRRR